MAVKWSDFGCSLEDNQLEKELGGGRPVRKLNCLEGHVIIVK